MGKFIDTRPKPEPERKATRKHPQIWHGTWEVKSSELDLLSKAVAEASDRYAFEVGTPVPGQARDIVNGTCTYHARGANRTDVEKHIFRENGLTPVSLKLDRQNGGVKMLCKCKRQDDSCTDDNDYWP